MFVGPLPPPDMLKAYNEVEPGLAARIIEMAEAEAQHRREREREESVAAVQVALKEADDSAAETCNSYNVARWGQNFAAIIGVTSLGCATYLGTHGDPTTAGIMVGASLVAAITAFLRGSNAPDTPKELTVRPKESDEGGAE